jgi:4-aminobutyrate aminotransferase-like enzyme
MTIQDEPAEAGAAYAERLTATLPDGLGVCCFVNSGSEAGELALRMAHAPTDRTGAVVLGGGYHGTTTSLVGGSPCKFNGRGGSGRPAHVLARRIAFDLRRAGILISTDGPDNNVLKIKPPMPFGRDDADALVTAIRRSLCDQVAGS